MFSTSDAVRAASEATRISSPLMADVTQLYVKMNESMEVW